MPDVVVDTNVLLCASAADPGSSFGDAEHITTEHQLTVLTWLGAFRNDPDRLLIMDESFRIYDEYRNKLTDQDFGLLAIHDKLMTARLVPVEYDEDGYGTVPADLGALDPSDRKLAAAAVATVVLHDGRCTLTNATDTDWYDVDAALEGHGVVVEQLLPAYCRAKYDEKKARSAR